MRMPRGRRRFMAAIDSHDVELRMLWRARGEAIASNPSQRTVSGDERCLSEFLARAPVTPNTVTRVLGFTRTCRSKFQTSIHKKTPTIQLQYQQTLRATTAMADASQPSNSTQDDNMEDMEEGAQVNGERDIHLRIKVVCAGEDEGYFLRGRAVAKVNSYQEKNQAAHLSRLKMRTTRSGMRCDT